MKSKEFHEVQRFSDCSCCVSEFTSEFCRQLHFLSLFEMLIEYSFDMIDKVLLIHNHCFLETCQKIDYIRVWKAFFVWNKFFIVNFKVFEFLEHFAFCFIKFDVLLLALLIVLDFFFVIFEITKRVGNWILTLIFFG